MSTNDPKIEATTRVSISFEVEIDDITLGDCYPDGVPDGCTSEQLLATIQESRGLGRFMSDWCLDDDAFITVNVPGSQTAHGNFRRSFTLAALESRS